MGGNGTAGAEWLGVIERQQQEIELLRQELAVAAPPLGLLRRGSDASIASSVASLAFSVLSARDEEVPMDSERYARICSQMERMRAALTSKDAKLQKARAQRSEAHRALVQARHSAETLRSELETQRAQLAREHAASQDAVDNAVEKAAHALIKCDELGAELSKLREKAAKLREDDRERSNAVQQAEIAQQELEKKLQDAQQKVEHQTSGMCALRIENNRLKSELQAVQEELATKRRRDSEWNELNVHKQMLQQRVKELELAVQRHVVQLHQNARLIDQQNERIHRLKEEQVLAERAASVERAEDESHAAHLLKNNIALQHELESEQSRNQKLLDQTREAFETSQLTVEELLQTKMEVAGRDQVMQHRGEKYCELLSAYRGLGRHAQALERSERELVSVLVLTKKRLALLQNTLTRFCYELEAVSKQMATSRNRELSLGRALREYGKRNRQLQASVAAARQQLHSVVSAFRSSERRKEQAISASWNLKRDLVIERCQRSDLVRQCKELETCLDSCQSSAFETQSRAEGLEKDNGVLQHAVTQLVAYAKELMNSQQSLQKELTKLEITGKRQPAVYG